MITFFILIVFIAELIIALQLITLIIKYDKKVCEINSDIIRFQPVIKSGLIDIRVALNTVLLHLNKLHIKIKEQKDKYKIIVIRKIITTILFLILNLNGRKIFAIVDFIFSINDFKNAVKNFTA